MTPQHAQALTRANEVRTARAELKRSITTGHHSILATITNPPDCCATASPMEMLRAVNGFGKTKSAALLRSARVSATRRLGDLTDSERGRLCAVVRTRLRAG